MTRLPIIAALLLACLANPLSPAQSSLPASQPKPATTHPLGTAEKYTFANPQTPLKDLQAACNLTDDQAAKITAIQYATKKANADYESAHADQLKAARDDMVAATKRNDWKSVGTLSQKVRDLEKPMTDAWEKARFDILALLTPDQAQAWRKANVLNSAKFVYAKITFTPDQLDKIGAIYDDLAKQSNATYEDINGKMMSQKIPPLLTPQQKQKMGVK